MSVAEELVSALRKMPREDRIPTIKLLLQASGPGIEERVLQHEQALKDKGDDPKTALVTALEKTIHEPGGHKILDVIATAAAREVVDQGLARPDQVEVLTRQFEGSLRQEEGIQDEGLGFIGAIIAAAAAVVSIAASGISSAIKRAKARRRLLKAKLTPLKSDEIANIVQATAPSLVGMPSREAFLAAQERIQSMIGDIREGRTDYLLDPATGSRAGSRVNEYRDIRDAFYDVHSRARNALIEDQQKKKALVGAAAAVGGAALIGGIAWTLL